MHATYLAILVSCAHERAKRYASVMPVYPQIIRQQVWKHNSNDYYIHEHFYMLLTTQTYRVNRLGVKPRGARPVPPVEHPADAPPDGDGVAAEQVGEEVDLGQSLLDPAAPRDVRDQVAEDVRRRARARPEGRAPPGALSRASRARWSRRHAPGVDSGAVSVC